MCSCVHLSPECGFDCTSGLRLDARRCRCLDARPRLPVSHFTSDRFRSNLMSTQLAEQVLRSRLASAVEVEQVPWLWPGWIPRGTVTVLDGDPGLGKSTIAVSLAARVSRGLALPDETDAPNRTPARVLLASAE